MEPPQPHTGVSVDSKVSAPSSSPGSHQLEVPGCPSPGCFEIKAVIYVGTRHVAYWHVLPAPLVTCHLSPWSALSQSALVLSGTRCTPISFGHFLPSATEHVSVPPKEHSEPSKGTGCGPRKPLAIPWGWVPARCQWCLQMRPAWKPTSLQPHLPLPALSVFPVPPRGRPRWCLLGPLQTSSVLSLCC